MPDKVVMSLVLNRDRDGDILHWLDAQEGSKSAAIRAALRAYIDARGVTLGDVYQAVKSLERKLARGVVLAGPAEGPAEVEEPPDVVAALDNLGL